MLRLFWGFMDKQIRAIGATDFLVNTATRLLDGIYAFNLKTTMVFPADYNTIVRSPDSQG